MRKVMSTPCVGIQGMRILTTSYCRISGVNANSIPRQASAHSPASQAPLRLDDAGNNAAHRLQTNGKVRIRVKSMGKYCGIDARVLMIRDVEALICVKAVPGVASDNLVLAGRTPSIFQPTVFRSQAPS